MNVPPPSADPMAQTRQGLGLQARLTIGGAASLLVLLLVGMAQEQVWVLFASPVDFLTNDATGLTPGLPVRLSGYRIGSIDRVELQRNAKVRVSLRIQPTYRPLLGPRSRVRLDQEGLVGSTYLSVTADPRGKANGNTPLELSYDPPVDLKGVLLGLAQSRIPLNRLLDRTATLTETSLPRTISQVQQTMEATSSLSRTLERQSVLTATQARATMRTYQELGEEGRQNLNGSRQELESLVPELRGTLKDVRGTAQTSQRLLDRLSGSWVLPLLEGPKVPTSAPTGTTSP